ncbi:MAG: AlkZ family DNA glycosylase [Ktedonobacteraceae bacterium]|nr:AlkZ family DNA glycosylase [Ktedonobacteraceae bacterium]
MRERVLTLRELNRATLARQLLLERASLTPLAAIKQLAGMQGQLANPPYIGLWSRLQSFRKSDLTELLERLEVVRTSMMRRTLHLTTAEDYLHFRPALAALHTRHLESFFAQLQIDGLTRERLLAEIQDFLREKPRTNVELRARLAELIPQMGERLLYVVRASLPLIQVFPGGAWGVGGSPAYAPAPLLLGRSFVPSAEGLRTLIRSYLAAFGPASIKDLQIWSGLSRLQPAFETLRPELVTFRDEQDRKLFDLPGAPLPSRHTPAPVRFIPDFDNLVLAHADRQRVIPDHYRPYVFPGNSMVLPTFLIDGFVSGVWHIERTPAVVRLIIQPFEPLPASTSQELQAEGHRLLTWAAEKIDTFEIVLNTYDGKSGKQNMWGSL